MTTITLSPQQQAVLDWADARTTSLNLIARAGCGKTSTLLALTEHLFNTRPHDNIFLGAFNKSIATEITTRLTTLLPNSASRVNSSTLHSLGFRLWRSAAPKVRTNDRKMQDILSAQLSEKSFPVLYPILRAACSIAKQNGAGFASDREDTGWWFDLLDHYSLDEVPEGVTLHDIIRHAILALTTSATLDTQEIDFDDMILAPLLHSTPNRSLVYDWVALDEAQDVNITKRALALKIMRPRTGRLIAVGDPAQAIYGFTGADSNSMDNIRSQLHSDTLPLTLTYRCPKRVVAEAQKYVPDIRAHSSAPEGEVLHRTLRYANKHPLKPTEIAPEEFTAQDAILCRNTAPLITLAYTLIGKRIACRVEGRDIGQGLKKLASRWRVTDLSALESALEDYLDAERAKWLAKGREEKAAALEDKVTSLLTLINLCREDSKHTLADLHALIDSMFDDTTAHSKRTLTLSTIHKSKGREWPRVFILNAAKLMPSPYARKDWQLQQESNLAYVAITRAQSTLVYLEA